MSIYNQTNREQIMGLVAARKITLVSGRHPERTFEKKFFGTLISQKETWMIY